MTDQLPDPRKMADDLAALRSDLLQMTIQRTKEQQETSLILDSILRRLDVHWLMIERLDDRTRSETFGPQVLK